jgi:hypothetical protein
MPHPIEQPSDLFECSTSTTESSCNYVIFGFENSEFFNSTPFTDTTSNKTSEVLLKEKLVRDLSSLQVKACSIKDDEGVKIIEKVNMIRAEARALLKPETILQPAWEPDDDHPVSQPEPTLRLNNVRIGSPGNITGIIANPGSGKSQSCEAMGAAFLNPQDPEVDTLGFSLSPTIKSFYYLDTEQSIGDSDYGYRRCLRRARVSRRPENFYWKSITTFDNFDDKRNFVYNEMETLKPSLMIIDGIGDLIPDTNNIEDSNSVILGITSRAKRYGINVVCTIHGNPKASQNGASSNEKARGHIGSELQRKAESMIMIQRDEGDIRKLTTNFANGKNRSDSDNINLEFAWNSDKMMFTTLTSTEKMMRKTVDSETKIKDDDILYLMLSKGGRRHLWKYGDIQNYMPQIDGDGAKMSYGALRQQTNRFIKRTHMLKEGGPGDVTYSVPDRIQINDNDAKFDSLGG